MLQEDFPAKYEEEVSLFLYTKGRLFPTAFEKWGLIKA